MHLQQAVHRAGLPWSQPAACPPPSTAAARSAARPYQRSYGHLAEARGPCNNVSSCHAPAGVRRGVGRRLRRQCPQQGGAIFSAGVHDHYCMCFKGKKRERELPAWSEQNAGHHALVVTGRNKRPASLLCALSASQFFSSLAHRTIWRTAQAPGTPATGFDTTARRCPRLPRPPSPPPRMASSSSAPGVRNRAAEALHRPQRGNVPVRVEARRCFKLSPCSLTCAKYQPGDPRCALPADPALPRPPPPHRSNLCGLAGAGLAPARNPAQD